MSLLYPWMLFFLIPLFVLYKQNILAKSDTKRRQRQLLFLSLVFMILSSTRPVILNTPEEQKFQAKDYIIALDASFSMQADDLAPSRYQVAKNNIQKLIQKLPNDRFSIFAFTTNSMLLSPPTRDRRISTLALNSLEPKYILTKGTSLFALFKTISKISLKKKEVVIFSDGGEDTDLAQLVHICKQSNIIPYIVATASANGTTLKKEDRVLLDEKKNLVISRENPLLKPLADACDGHYYQLRSSDDISSKISNDLEKNAHVKNLTSKVMNYKELFIVPLTIAFVSFFLGVTKLHTFILPVLFLVIPYQVKASSLFDFYHLNRAKTAYQQHTYAYAAQEFIKLTPSVSSYYNSGVALYRAKKYKQAMQYFVQIKTADRQLKEKIFYNLGNSAAKLKYYALAQSYYQKALVLREDKDTLENLALVSKMLRINKEHKIKLPSPANKKQSTQKKEPQKQKKRDKTQEKKKSAGSKKSSKQASQQSSGGGANNKKNKQKKKNLQKTNHTNKSQYKIGYKAYELINKGYTNEKHPW